MENKSINDMIERYIYDVTRRLPENQRDDIKKELWTLIEDTLYDKAGEEAPTDEDLHQVLEDLGNPADFARKYRGGEKYLIGGEYYDSYCYILKIVLLCAGVGLLISVVVSALVNSVHADNMISYFANEMINIGTIPGILVNIFAWITIGFIVIEQYQIKFDMGIGSWTPEKLPQMPNKKAVINRTDTVVGLVFNVLCGSLLCFAPHLIGAWIKDGDIMRTIPVFNLEIWSSIMPLFAITFMLAILGEVIKLLVGRYNRTVVITSIFTDLIAFIITVVIFKGYNIWNPAFVLQLEKILGRTFDSKHDIFSYWNTATFSNICVAIFFLIYLIDIGESVYHMIRYEMNA